MLEWGNSLELTVAKLGSLACENGHYFNAKYRGCNNSTVQRRRRACVVTCDARRCGGGAALTQFLLN